MFLTNYVLTLNDIVMFCSGLNRKRKYFVSLASGTTVRDQGTKYDVFARLR